MLDLDPYIMKKGSHPWLKEYFKETISNFYFKYCNIMLDLWKKQFTVKGEKRVISELFSKLFSGDNFLLERRWRGAASRVVIYADRECDTIDSREDLSHSLEKICPSPSLNIKHH
jgi:hypothetical protein